AIMLNPQRAEYEFYIYSPATRIDNIADFTTDLRIYPNPTKGILTINSEEVLGKIELYNIYGSLISSREVTKNSYKLDLSNLAEGIYILKGNGASYKIQKVN
ncbi:MAG: T9SS type A sorting domain-containing protein, partial [Vicingaceae bacterium]|nr:T9SS type A sorting domain-containing protein [Vicingaceae bacterium]